MNKPSTTGANGFEHLKQVNEHGAEYWSARDLQPLLGYDQWRRFAQAITRAQEACKESGNEPGNHFAGAGKMVLRVTSVDARDRGGWEPLNHFAGAGKPITGGKVQNVHIARRTMPGKR